MSEGTPGPRAPEPKRGQCDGCSCLGFWYRRRCRHIIAYREAVALVVAQDAVNTAWSPIPDNLSAFGVSPVVGLSQVPGL